MELVGYAACIAMGVVLGLLGGGGSILTVPIMVYLFGLSPLVATAYSLFVVGLTAAIGSAISVRRGDVDFNVAVAFAIPGAIGVGLSRAFIVPALPSTIATFSGFTLSREVLIMLTFAVVMVAASISMIRKKKERTAVSAAPLTKFATIALQGLVVGVIVGFVGAGGGFLIIPALVVVAGLPMKVAVGTSLLSIAFQSLLGFTWDFTRGLPIDWKLLTSASTAAVAGIVIGSALAHKIKDTALKTAFGWLVLTMGAVILLEQFRHLSYR